ncbi:putative MYND domain protein [Xylaria venustula]|nr:putative MYND domain protein [Xylaria venustula]
MSRSFPGQLASSSHHHLHFNTRCPKIDTSAKMQGTCNGCKKTSADLKKCAKCSTTLYCSRECQKSDWKAHKKICGKQAHETHTPSSASASTPVSPPKGLEKPITQPFTRLSNNTYLHDRPEQDVVGVLIDSYRMRIEDEYTFEGNASADSIYGGADSSLPGFRKFLRSASSRPGLLPSWWSPTKQKECEELGMGSSTWSSLRCAVEKSDVIDHYGDQRFPMQLRMLAEQVLGRGFAGNNGSAMMSMMASMESGGSGDNRIAMIADMRTGNSSRHM